MRICYKKSLPNFGGRDAKPHSGCQKVRKNAKNLHLLLTTPQKYDIITISLIIDPRIALTLRFYTNVSLQHFTFALFGAERTLTSMCQPSTTLYLCVFAGIVQKLGRQSLRKGLSSKA